MSGSVLIKFENVFKSYGKIKVLENINFEIKEREVLGILGLSGCGKTTLLNLLSGVLDCDFGKITYFSNGEKLNSISSFFKNSKSFLGYSVQDYSFYNELSVLENLNYFKGLFNVDNKLIIEKLLSLFNLSDFKNMRASELSGGMKKRLDIACALLGNPKVLVFDEPTESLDFSLRESLFRIIRNLNLSGLTIIYVSHILEDIEKICNRVLVLNNKKIYGIENIENIKEKFEEVLENE